MRTLEELFRDFNLEKHRQELRDWAKEKLSPSKYGGFKKLVFNLPNGANTSVRIYPPTVGEPPYPTLFYIPGTGYIALIDDIAHSVCDKFTGVEKFQVIIVNHLLAPEHPAPMPLNSLLYSLRLLIAHADKLKIDKNKMCIGGYSSGAGFAILAAIALAKQGIKFKWQFLIAPAVDLARRCKGFEEFEGQDPILDEDFIRIYTHLYLSGGMGPDDPWISPVSQPIAALEGLAPTDVVLGDIDSHRSGTEEFLRRLDEARVCCQTIRIPGKGHALLWYKSDVPAMVGARMLSVCGLEDVPRPLESPQPFLQKALMDKEEEASAVATDSSCCAPSEY